MVKSSLSRAEKSSAGEAGVGATTTGLTRAVGGGTSTGGPRRLQEHGTMRGALNGSVIPPTPG